MDYEIQRCTRHCAATGRELKPGEIIYTLLQLEGGHVKRLDYAAEAWPGPPAESLGWWKSQIPHPHTHKVQLAPNDVMLDLLERWEADPQQHDIRYVLSLLLVRRRVLRLEETEHTEAGAEVNVLYCPRRDVTYRVLTVMPDEPRIKEIQDQLSQLLFSGAALAPSDNLTDRPKEGASLERHES